MAEITSEVSSNDKNLAVLTHLGGILFSFIPSLIVWLLKKDNAYVSEQAKEALNFQITILIGWVISYILMIILIGFLLMGIIWLANIILCILAAVATSKGENYRYPFTLRLIN
ncbi:MAG TPA: DUF4870 domain-containing protein [Methylophilaceae bacterium]|jgi:uncharacterized protein|nr:DUF4870 domain-containing protein [Methylophilaceae bacterium]